MVVFVILALQRCRQEGYQSKVILISIAASAAAWEALSQKVNKCPSNDIKTEVGQLCWLMLLMPGGRGK